MSELPAEGPDVATYAEIQTEVDTRFAGDWEKFLKAVTNPAEILHFILENEFAKDKSKFEAWAQEKKLPADWVPRFYSTLTAEGDLAGKPSS